MAQGDGRVTTPRVRRNVREPNVNVLKNKIVTARTEHLLICGCLLDKGKPYHYTVASLFHPETSQRAFVCEKSHAGPCPKSGVIN